MKTKKIVFTEPCVAELLEVDIPEISDNEVLIETEYTVISGGTERAGIMGMPNTGKGFPRSIGYCGIGKVLKKGSAVSSVSVGDRVLIYHGCHTKHNIRTEKDITKVCDASIPSLDAAFVIIASMGLGGVRRLGVEIGESAMVMGLGLLGIFSIQFLRLSGAYPIIAADLNPARRELALSLGADYALDPTSPDFTEKVKEITGGGVRATVEVTGVSAALKTVLECSARGGRISLLGCTRVSDCGIDFYSQVHKPGITLLGAHNMARPQVESYPHHWTHQDDCRAILDLIGAGRIKVAPIVSRVVSPACAREIYKQLCEDPQFPMGTVWDWKDIE